MRLPFAPLTRAVGEVYNPSSVGNQHGRTNVEWVRNQGNPTGMLSEITGISRRRLVRWTRDGVPLEQADRIAVALGLHVSEIWPEWFTESD